MAKIRLTTLKHCFEFFEWLNNGGGPKKDVVTEFVQRLTPYFPQMSGLKGPLQKEFFKFLANVSLLYKTLSAEVTMLGTYKVTTRDRKHILEALLECTPKLLAALSFIQYHVDEAFSNVGGGGWATKSIKSGDFQTFLTNRNNILAGGFSAGELNNVQGSRLVEDLKKILNKERDGRGKGVHDHFRNVILTTLGKEWNTFNTGNTVLLVYTFCQLVTKRTELDGGAFKTALEKGLGRTICWQDLKSHCQLLKEHIDTLTGAGFSFTGRASIPKEHVKLATEAAKWFSGNLPAAANVLKDMIPHTADISTLRSFAKDHLYTHGFIFDGSKWNVWHKPPNLNKWDRILQMFRQLDGLLGKLKDILDGTYRNSCQPLVTKTEATKTEAAKPVATKTEVTKPQAKNAGGSTNQNTSQSGAKPGTSSVGTSSSPPTGSAGAPGSQGDRGKKGPGGSVSPEPAASPGKPTVKSQQTASLDSPVTSPHAPPPITPAAPASPSQPSGGGGSANGGGGAGLKVGGSSSTGHPQTPGAPSPGTASSGGSGNNGGQGLSGAGQQGDTSKGTNGGSLTSQQLAGAQVPASHQPPTAQSPGPQSTGVPGSSSDKGLGGQAGASGAAQRSVQGTHPGAGDSSAVSAIADSALGVGQSGGGAGGGVEKVKTLSPQQQLLEHYGQLLKNNAHIFKKQAERNDKAAKNMEEKIQSLNEKLHNIWQDVQEKNIRETFGQPTLPNIQTQDHSALQNASGLNSPGLSLQPNSHHPGVLPQTPQRPRWSGKGNHPATYADYDISRGYNPLNSLDGYAISDPFDVTMDGVAIPDTSFDEEEKNRQTRLQAHDERQLIKEKVDHQAYVNMQANDILKSVEEVKNSENKVLQEIKTLLEEEERQKLITTGFDGEPVVGVDYLDGEEIKHESPSKHEHERYVQLQAYDQATNIQRDKQKQWEQHYQEQNEKINNSQEEHQQEIKRTLDAINYFKEVEYRRQREAAEAVTGVPLFSKTAFNLLESPDHSTVSTLPMVTGAPIPKSNQLLPMPNGGFDTAMPPHPTIHLEIEKPHYSRIIYGFKELGNSQTPSNSIEPALPDYAIPNMDPNSDTDHSNYLGVFKNYGFTMDPNPNMCNNPWNYVYDSATSSTLPPLPYSDHLPPPTNVKAMLFWLVGLNAYGLIAKMERHMENILNEINGDTFYPKYALQVNGDLSSLSASHIADTLTEACLYSAHVLNGIMRMNSKNAWSPTDFESVYSKFHYSPDPACLLCQLRDYVYACHHQLQFLKSQCNRNKLSGGWKNDEYGSDITASKSPLQSFLTDSWDCDFKTHLFDPCNLCHKSRVRMGFKKDDLPNDSQTGNTISSILTPSCGGSDPLLTLSSYLNCLTRRTPRTTGELLSFFHNFGIELHNYDQKALSSLGTAITKSHADYPDWDHLGRHDLDAVRRIRGAESLNSISNHNHDKDHPHTLSTLVGCGSDPDSCPQHCSPITYRAYALYSQSFAHTYLSWTVYLPNRLHESLQKLYYDLQKHRGSSKCSALNLCSTALPLLYLHGITPPEVGSQVSLTCSDVICELKDVITGKPIADLMTCMDNFLYGIREPFIFTVVAMWSLAFLVFANTMLYRLDVLHIRSHLIRTKASHHIDVKALLTKGRKMLSLYKDVDYFDEDPIGQLVL
ncbi:hypothetical protein BBBOND_0310650 [Babesia bigemina]|uniref:Ribosome binding protein n=1 Tax=Babesia bigemina TaxID=5866 RepID=A0A061DAZ5_BABBI|nr:hypothetical protein BBBOND_0310650 [Babesia bigemina]CDR97162.1 hypothetical protein BBBOND_0310650 [Babesia bigemina]|eukprot:XP_012769348.1 hypothetical protein BBBOND_0310650 [Babesia bigemina]